ncbi:DUF2510 domain-containing protein [Amnibacterium kyonggiense]
MDTPALPAGWYTDSTDAAYLRYWTGTSWSSHRKSRPGLPAAYQQKRSRGRFALSRRIA